MLTTAQQPDIIQEHWYHTYTTLTADVNAWADDHPDIVDLTIAGQTELGKNLWVVRISDWSNDTKADVELILADGSIYEEKGNIDFVNHVAEKNVYMTIENIREKSPVLKEMEDQGEIKIIGAMYDIKDGSVTFYE